MKFLTLCCNISCDLPYAHDHLSTNVFLSFFSIHQHKPFQYQISIKFPHIKAQSNENSSTYHEPNPKINTRGKKTICTVSEYRSTRAEYSLFVRLVASGQSGSGKNRPNMCNLPSTAGHAVSLQYPLTKLKELL
jgi:hypothetical protein